MVPVYGGKNSSRKAVHADDEGVKTEVRKWLRQQSKDFYAAGFDAMVKRWDICINVSGEDMSRNKCFFSSSNITWFTFHIHL
jgi:head-tail adaptor